MNHAPPQEALQGYLETGMQRAGHVPRVLLVDQEQFRASRGDPLFPSIVHTVTNQTTVRTMHRIKPVRFYFAVRIHATESAHIEGIHRMLGRLSDESGRRVSIEVVSNGRNIDPSFYWRVLTVSMKARGGTLFPRPAPEVALLYGPAADPTRVLYGPAADPTRMIYP